MKSSEYYEHQLNEEQLRSDQLQDKIDTLKCQLDDLKAERKELVEVLTRISNNASGRKWNGESQGPDFEAFSEIEQAAREALKKASETP